jgi:hypothetical protein
MPREAVRRTPTTVLGPEHPVSLAKRDIEVVSHHVTLNWRQSAVRYLAAVTELQAP